MILCTQLGELTPGTKVVYIVAGPKGARFFIPGYVVADAGAEITVKLRCKGKRTQARQWAPLTARRGHLARFEWS